MLIPSIIYFVVIFILLLIFISLGSKLIDINEILGAIIMFIVGAAIPYIVAILMSLVAEKFQYRWFHFVVIILLVAMMNNGNASGETTKVQKIASTFLFVGVIMISVLMFWIV